MTGREGTCTSPLRGEDSLLSSKAPLHLSMLDLRLVDGFLSEFEQAPRSVGRKWSGRARAFQHPAATIVPAALNETGE